MLELFCSIGRENAEIILSKGFTDWMKESGLKQITIDRLIIAARIPVLDFPEYTTRVLEARNKIDQIVKEYKENCL